MRLKTISVSESNYRILGDFGRAGQSFNDVISELIALVPTRGNPKLNNDIKKLQSEHRTLNHTQTASSSVSSDE
jgi:predicted CopG family antitoxin